MLHLKLRGAIQRLLIEDQVVPIVLIINKLLLRDHMASHRQPLTPILHELLDQPVLLLFLALPWVRHLFALIICLILKFKDG